MNYDHLLYKRGYLFSQAEVEPPVSAWTKKTIGDYFISFDPENLWAFSQKGDNWVALLGKAVDILHWSMDVHAIVNQCLNRLNYSEEKMLDYIDYLSGRFIIIYHHGNQTKFMTDAFGTRTAFYSLQNSVLVASHCRIISDYLDSSESKQMAKIDYHLKWHVLYAHAYPGISTPYEGVYILTPNTQINIEERKIQRFYPRRELPIGNLSSAVEEVSVMLKRQLELLNSQHDLMISLTAGIDSRTTLATARDIAGDVLFFTYGQRADYNSFTNEALRIGDRELAESITQIHKSERRGLENDLLVASEIAEVLGLRHIRLDDVMAQHKDFQEFSKVLSRNTYYSRTLRLALEYMDKLPSGLLHIQSGVSELGRAYYRREGFMELPLTPRIMGQAWGKLGRQEWTGIENNEVVIKAFQEFAEVTEFANIMNYDPYDMFWWEHRHGTWLSCSILQYDVAFDTFETFNCRALMEKVLSVPVEYRMESAVHREIIRRLWPMLLLWPINEPPFKLQLEQLRAEHAMLRRETTRLQAELATVQSSFSFQLGNMLVQAVCKPGRNTVFLPYRLLRLTREALRRRAQQ